ncbi:hypothetical protein PGTUg99_012441, partial [Puccinia graminis f. sp. tritici]
MSINEIAQFARNSAALHNSSADYILSSIRQDAIVENAKFERKTTELKNLILQKSSDTDTKIDLLNKAIQDNFCAIKNELLAVRNHKLDAPLSPNDIVDDDLSKKEERDPILSSSNRQRSRDVPPHQTNNGNQIRN